MSELAFAIDGILQDQARSDTEYFLKVVDRVTSKSEAEAIARGFLKAYRWKYIFSGAENTHFVKAAQELTTAAQMQRIASALQTLT